MLPESVDQIRLDFSPETMTALNVVIGAMMFGVALDMKLGDFRKIIASPKGPAIGLLAQFLLLPALTFLLVHVLPVTPSMALGMILVASCPGGNLSNLMTYLAGGNTALSVSMTAVSTVAAIFMTPLNLAFWGGASELTAPILRDVHLSPLDVLGTIVLVLGVPLVLGILTSRALPQLADKVRGPFKTLAFLFFLVVVGFALTANLELFVAYVGLVAFGVIAHNAAALSLGWLTARAAGLPSRDRRAVCLEVGIQNSGLALLLIFNFFEGLGGMALIAAFWGIWHIVAGASVALVMSRGRRRAPAVYSEVTS